MALGITEKELHGHGVCHMRMTSSIDPEEISLRSVMKNLHNSIVLLHNESPFLLRQNNQNIKFTILSDFKCSFQWQENRHAIVQTSLLSIFRTFSFPKLKPHPVSPWKAPFPFAYPLTPCVHVYVWILTFECGCTRATVLMWKPEASAGIGPGLPPCLRWNLLISS